MFLSRFITYCCLIFTLFAPGAVFGNGHLVSPLALNFDLESRDIVDSSLKITNQSGQQMRLYASVNEVSTDGDGVLESFQPPVNLDRTNSPTSWIEITRGRIELAAGETVEIPFTIRMNPKTKPGDYDVFIGFATGSNEPEATRKVVAGQAPGSLIRISVDQKQNQFLRLERFTSDRFITGSGDDVLTVAVANPGVADIVPKGEIIFYQSNGEEVAAAELNPDDVVVPGEGSYEYQVPAPTDLGIGKYKAFLSLEYGENLTTSLNDTIYFYVAPLHQLLLFFILFLFIVILLTWYLYNRYQDDDFDDHDSVPMYVSQTRSPDQHHDIDLTKKYDS